MKGIDYFIKSLSGLSNLFRPYQFKDEVPYEIVKQSVSPGWIMKTSQRA